MITIVVKEKTPNEIVDIVRELKKEGLTTGKDFDFAFHQRRWDPMIGDVKGFTDFIFYNEKLATWFVLKWT